MLSDTHGWLDPQLLTFFSACEEVWHCGDIGSLAVTDELAKHFRVRAVYGNIDGGNTRLAFPETDGFVVEGVKVLMTHIGGYPGHYDIRIRNRLFTERPALFVCGHSHIAKVMYDRNLACLHINPGAAGRIGIHKVRTAVRFEIMEGNIGHLDLVEYKRG